MHHHQMSQMSIFRLMIGILAACLLVKGIFWTQKPNGWIPKRNTRTQVNLLTRTEIFQLESVYLYYLIFEGSTVLFDHLFNAESRLYFSLFTSITIDSIVLFILPTLILYRSKYNNLFLWEGRKLEVKKSDFLIISGSIEPRRDLIITKSKPKRIKRIRYGAVRMETIQELPYIEVWFVNYKMKTSSDHTFNTSVY